MSQAHVMFPVRAGRALTRALRGALAGVARSAPARAVVSQLRTPEYQNPDLVRLPFRHITARKAMLPILIVVVVMALALPLLLLTSWLGNTPASWSKDPAVQALQIYERSLDGSPSSVKAADGVRSSLLIRTLPDGSVKASRTGESGRCFYLVIPAQVATPAKGVKLGTAADCR